MPFSKMTNSDKKTARAAAEAAGLAEMRHLAEKQREKSEKLKQLRLERDAALPAKEKAAARKKPTSTINLSQAQKSAKK